MVSQNATPRYPGAQRVLMQPEVGRLSPGMLWAAEEDPDVSPAARNRCSEEAPPHLGLHCVGSGSGEAVACTLGRSLLAQPAPAGDPVLPSSDTESSDRCRVTIGEAERVSGHVCLLLPKQVSGDFSCQWQHPSNLNYGFKLVRNVPAGPVLDGAF